MIDFDIPKNLNGTTLIDALSEAGINVAINPTYGVACPTIHEGKMYLAIEEKDRAKAQQVINALS